MFQDDIMGTKQLNSILINFVELPRKPQMMQYNTSNNSKQNIQDLKKIKNTVFVSCVL